MRIAIALVCVLALLGGCKRQNPMVGTWNLEFVKKDITQASVQMVFKDDNTFTITSRLQNDAHTAEGTYTLEEKSLTITAKGDGGQPGVSKTLVLDDDLKSFEPPSGGAIGKMVKQTSEKP